MKGSSQPIRIKDFHSEESLRKAVVLKVDELIELTYRIHSNWNPPPFRPEIFADALGIPIIIAYEQMEELKDWDALLVPLKDGARIICNGTIPNSRRIAFSIGHEIAHLFFDGYASKRYHLRTSRRAEHDRSEEERRIERLCDLGAAELLMPQAWFKKAIDRYVFCASALPKIADEFTTSLEAAAVRLVEMSQEDCSIVFFEYADPPSFKRLDTMRRRSSQCKTTYRVRRAFHSKDFPFLFPVGKSVPDESVVYRSSLGLKELGAKEIITLGRRKEKLKVTAYPLHRQKMVIDPPTVCGIFTKP